MKHFQISYVMQAERAQYDFQKSCAGKFEGYNFPFIYYPSLRVLVPFS
jgi:hypothetical protein